MKRFFAMIYVFVAALALVACKGGEKFDVDGEFTAFEVTEHNGAPMVTSVTVTIKNGKISKFYIDALQGSKVEEGEVITAVNWNEKTKKELKFDYGMKDVGPRYEFKDGAWKVVEGKTSEKEWFEQAELLEAKWLKDGVDSLTLTKDADGAERIDNVAGVTLKDGGYIKLAKQAVENARAGKVVVFKTGLSKGGAAEIYFVEATFNKEGKATEIVIDTRQSKVDAEKGLIWNEKTKQELGFEYRMHYSYYQATLEEGDEGTIEGYKAWLKDNNELEWFEQVAKISADVVATQKSTAPADAIAGVTVVTDTYYELIANAFAAVK